MKSITRLPSFTLLCHKLSRMMDQKADVAVQKEMVTKIETTSQRISVIIKGLRSFARDGSKDPFSSCNLNQSWMIRLPFVRNGLKVTA